MPVAGGRASEFTIGRKTDKGPYLMHRQGIQGQKSVEVTEPTLPAVVIRIGQPGTERDWKEVYWEVEGHCGHMSQRSDARSFNGGGGTLSPSPLFL